MTDIGFIKTVFTDLV